MKNLTIEKRGKGRPKKNQKMLKLRLSSNLKKNQASTDT